jgi:hypothetical protein
MYASLRKYKLKPNSTTEINKHVNETFVPMLKKAAGFVAYCVIQTSGDSLASISVFETKSGAEESNRLAAGFVKEYVAPFIIGSPEITSGEVVASARK